MGASEAASSDEARNLGNRTRKRDPPGVGVQTSEPCGRIEIFISQRCIQLGERFHSIVLSDGRGSSEIFEVDEPEASGDAFFALARRVRAPHNIISGAGVDL